MSVAVRSISEITHEAMILLTRELGVADTLRFLSQFKTGMGNYTEERDALFGDMTLDEFFAEARRRFPPRSSDASVSTTPNLLDRITVNAALCGGQPCLRGYRIRVIDILDLLGAGSSMDEVLEEFENLEREDIQAVMQYASLLIRRSPAVAGLAMATGAGNYTEERDALIGDLTLEEISARARRLRGSEL